MNELSIVYVTAPDRKEAEKLAGAVLAERLAACVNIYTGVMSLYLWQGSVECSEEVTILFKTRSVLVHKLSEMIKKQHTYDLPCILSVPIDHADKDFAEWIKRETHRP